jgi:hypothetical protein
VRDSIRTFLVSREKVICMKHAMLAYLKRSWLRRAPTISGHCHIPCIPYDCTQGDRCPDSLGASIIPSHTYGF